MIEAIKILTEALNNSELKIGNCSIDYSKLMVKEKRPIRVNVDYRTM
jgi:hypothetical protein